VQNNGSSFYLYRVLACKLILHGYFTSLVTIEWIENVKSIVFHSLDSLFPWDENFLAEIELTNQEIRLKTMIHGPFFFRHAPPSEVHLLPRSAVLNLLVESVVTLGAIELFSDGLTVLEVCEGTGEDSDCHCTISQLRALGLT